MTAAAGGLDRTAGWEVVDEQRIALADLLESLTAAEWATPSLCGAWTVREVGAHLSLAATTGWVDFLLAAVRGRGNFDRIIRDTTVARAAARSDEQIVADLRAIVGSRRLAPTTLWRDPMLDLLVHGQDIARPLGRSLPMPRVAALEAAEWAWRRRFPFWPARRLRGVRLVADDADWTRGAGAELRGPIAALLLLSTGRRAALVDCRGPGVEVLARGGVGSVRRPD